jgi:hypothetical protein
VLPVPAHEALDLVGRRAARRDALTPMDLADEVFLSTTPSVSQTWRDFWMLTERLGRRPAIHERTADT